MPVWTHLDWWLKQEPPIDGRTLPWRVFDRVVRPFAFSVSMATFVVAISILTSSAAGGVLDTGLGQLFIGSVALLTTGLLWFAWWARRNDLMTHGLLLSAAVWASVGWEILQEGGNWTSGAIALCWSIGAAGAWLLEVNDPQQEGSGGE